MLAARLDQATNEVEVLPNALLSPAASPRRPNLEFCEWPNKGNGTQAAHLVRYFNIQTPCSVLVSLTLSIIYRLKLFIA